TLRPTLSGYPSFAVDLSQFTQWGADQPSLPIVETALLGYLIDATEGQSGSPIMAGGDSHGYAVVGVHHGSLDSCNFDGSFHPCTRGRGVDRAMIHRLLAACETFGGAANGCSLDYEADPPTTPTVVPSASRRLLAPIAPRGSAGW